jgi:hypothetical protein
MVNGVGFLKAFKVGNSNEVASSFFAKNVILSQHISPRENSNLATEERAGPVPRA